MKYYPIRQLTKWPNRFAKTCPLFVLDMKLKRKILLQPGAHGWIALVFQRCFISRELPFKKVGFAMMIFLKNVLVFKLLNLISPELIIVIQIFCTFFYAIQIKQFLKYCLRLSL